MTMDEDEGVIEGLIAALRQDFPALTVSTPGQEFVTLSVHTSGAVLRLVDGALVPGRYAGSEAPLYHLRLATHYPDHPSAEVVLGWLTPATATEVLPLVAAQMARVPDGGRDLLEAVAAALTAHARPSCPSMIGTVLPTWAQLMAESTLCTQAVLSCPTTSDGRVNLGGVVEPYLGAWSACTYWNNEPPRQITRPLHTAIATGDLSELWPYLAVD